MRKVLQIVDSDGMEVVTLVVGTERDWKAVCHEVGEIMDSYDSDTSALCPSFNRYLLDRLSFDFELIDFCQVSLSD